MFTAVIMFKNGLVLRFPCYELKIKRDTNGRIIAIDTSSSDVCNVMVNAEEVICAFMVSSSGQYNIENGGSK